MCAMYQWTVHFYSFIVTTLFNILNIVMNIILLSLELLNSNHGVVPCWTMRRLLCHSYIKYKRRDNRSIYLSHRLKEVIN